MTPTQNNPSIGESGGAAARWRVLMPTRVLMPWTVTDGNQSFDVVRQEQAESLVELLAATQSSPAVSGEALKHFNELDGAMKDLICVATVPNVDGIVELPASSVGALIAPWQNLAAQLLQATGKEETDSGLQGSAALRPEVQLATGKSEGGGESAKSLPITDRETVWLMNFISAHYDISEPTPVECRTIFHNLCQRVAQGPSDGTVEEGVTPTDAPIPSPPMLEISGFDPYLDGCDVSDEEVVSAIEMHETKTSAANNTPNPSPPTDTAEKLEAQRQAEADYAEALAGSVQPEPSGESDGPMPVFVLKAKDQLALATVNYYGELCNEFGLADQAWEVKKASDEMEAWREANPDQLKMPDHKHVPATPTPNQPTEGPKPTGTIFELDLFRERLERLADSFAAEGPSGFNKYDDGRASCAKDVRDAAAELKTLIDNCMKQYATPQPAQLGGSEAAAKLQELADLSRTAWPSEVGVSQAERDRALSTIKAILLHTPETEHLAEGSAE